MSEAIIVALIAGGLALLGNVMVSWAANSKTIYRIDELEKKVEKHNNMMERTFCLERDMKTAFNRLEEMREDIHEIENNR